MMFTLNDNERNFQEQLKKNIEIPFVVHDKTNTAYRMIESSQLKQKPASKDAWSRIRTGSKIAGGFVAVLALGFVVCVTNPVMARELPLVGGLFEQLQNEVSFFGNFADKATVLKEPENPASADADKQASKDTGTSDNTAAPADGVYTKTSDGLTLTFSEVYANDQAIYLTMLATSEEAFPDTMMQETETGTTHPVISMEADTLYSFIENQTDTFHFLQPEGKFLDDHTYSCIIRLDLASAARDTSEYNAQYEAMTQEIMDEMGITQEDMDDETEEGYALLSEFIDKVSARGGSLESYIKEISVPDSFTLRLNIKKLIGDKADPEYWDSGYSEEELAAMSEEEWQEVMSQEPAEYQKSPNQYENYWYEGEWSFDIPIQIDNSRTVTMEINETNEAGIGLKSVVKTPYELTANELYEEGSDSNCFMVALDADGNKLPYNASNGNCNNFAIQDRDISTVDIYILDYVQYMDELKGPERYSNNENKPDEEKWSTLLESNAKYHKTIHFD